MQRFLIIGLLSFTLSCQQNNNSIPRSAASADTSVTKPEEFQGEFEEENLFDLTYVQRKGKRLYDHYCAVCHGPEGQGDGFNAYNLDPKPKDMTEPGYLQSVSDDWLVEAISQGGRGVKRSVLMPSYENTLSKEQIRDIVAYLRFLSK